MKPEFLGSPIATPEALARSLGIQVQDLKTIAGGASSQYSDFKITKRDGTPRNVSGPKYDLKILQKRINRQLFERVRFPNYLYGGIQRRDYVQNARIHSGAKVVVALDIKNFYPNIKVSTVRRIFKNFFNFPDSVAGILTDLCTKNGSVPQGACTSSYIANLVFFQLEPRLVASLQEMGLKYTRLTDDISVSATKPISKKTIEKVIEKIASMLKLDGFRLKNKKTRISSDANPEQLMEITGLWLNRGAPRVKREERHAIRTEVRRCIVEGKTENTSREYHEFHSRVSGRVAKLTHLNHPEARRFRRALQLTLPVYDKADVKKTVALVNAICKTNIKSRGSISYIDRYYKAIYRINVLSRTEPVQAGALRHKMNNHLPTRRRDEVIHG